MDKDKNIHIKVGKWAPFFYVLGVGCVLNLNSMIYHC